MNISEIEEVIQEMQDFYDSEVAPEDDKFAEWIFSLKKAIRND